MPRPREYDEQTRHELIDAAGRLLAEHGPAAVTMRAVADQVGATTRAIYGLFGSKEELIRGMYRAGFEGLEASMDAVPDDDDPASYLRELGLAYRRSALERPHLYQVMFGWPMASFDPAPDDLEVADGTLDRLRTAVAACQAAGRLPGEDPDGITSQLWALTHGLASLELRGSLGDTAQATQHWDEALLAIFAGYAIQVPDRSA